MRFNGLVAGLALMMCATSVVALKQIIIAASTVFDGKGGVVHSTRILVEGSKVTFTSRGALVQLVRTPAPHYPRTTITSS